MNVYQPMYHLYHVPTTIYMFAKIAKGGRVPYIGLCRYTYLMKSVMYHLYHVPAPICLYIYTICTPFACHHMLGKGV